MSLASKFRINTEEIFPRLTKAPIVEAAIEVRAQAKIAWDEPLITEQLKTKLPDYPNVQSQREFKSTFEVGIGKKAKGEVLDLGWKGLRFESGDKLHIAQLYQDSFLFSRLQPYDSWKQFYDEGLRLWQLYMNLAKPAEIQRVGLRFINRMGLMPDEPLEDYLQILPQKPQGLDIPIGSFFHHEVLNVPDYPYAINIRRTIQPPNKTTDKKIGLILDIDVFTIQPFEPKTGIIEQYLAEMRWLKNKVFYGNITPKAREEFR
jgi:uncharacterized protein (TIGR04255 family)